MVLQMATLGTELQVEDKIILLISKKAEKLLFEISSTKLIPAAQLPTYWNYNKRSFLNFIEQSLYGIKGIVTDSASGSKS